MLYISDKNKFTLCRFLPTYVHSSNIIFVCLKIRCFSIPSYISCVNKSLLYLFSETFFSFHVISFLVISMDWIPSERYQLQSILLMRNACLNSDYGSKLIAYLYAVNLRIYIKIYFVQFDFRSFFFALRF